MLQFVRIGKNVIFSELGKLIFILEAGEFAFAYNSESMQAQTTEIHSTKCCKELPELLQVIKGNYSKTVDMEATYKGISQTCTRSVSSEQIIPACNIGSEDKKKWVFVLSKSNRRNVKREVPEQLHLMEYHCGITQDDTIDIFPEEQIQDTQIMIMT